MTPEEEAQAKQEKEEQEAAEAEAKRAEVLSAAEDKAAKAEESRIRAEAQLEAFKQVQAAQSGQSGGGGWTDEQWSAYSERTGVTKEQALAAAEIAQHEGRRVAQQFQGELEKATQRAVEAEKRLSKLESEQGTKEVKNEFFQAKPALARHKKVVDEFLAKFPEADQRDPAKLKELLDMAETYVKGKVGGSMRPAGDQGGGPRLRTNPNSEPEEEEEVDTRGLKSYEADFVRKTAGGISKESKQRLEEHASDRRDGIAVSGQKQWDEEAKKLKTMGR